jgi:hypothetical protein
MEIWQEVESYVEMQSDENYANCNTINGNPKIFKNVKYRKCFFFPQIYGWSENDNIVFVLHIKITDKLRSV